MSAFSLAPRRTQMQLTCTQYRSQSGEDRLNTITIATQKTGNRIHMSFFAISNFESRFRVLHKHMVFGYNDFTFKLRVLSVPKIAI